MNELWISYLGRQKIAIESVYDINIISMFPDKNWDWYYLSEHPDLSLEC